MQDADVGGRVAIDEEQVGGRTHADDTAIEPTGIYTPATYAHAMRAGDTLYVAGQVARAADGTLVAPGDAVTVGQTLFILEAMKMENEITAHKDGKVSKVSISVGDAVASGDPLVTIE